MDIDDIRIVVRYDLPPSLSEFYQVQLLALRLDCFACVRECSEQLFLSHWVALT